MVKTGQGADAFAGNAGRMGKTGPGRLHWNRFKWILFLWMTVVSTSGVWRGFPFSEAIAYSPPPLFFQQLTLYSLAALIFTLMIWFNVWHDAQVIRVGNHGELAGEPFIT